MIRRVIRAVPELERLRGEWNALLERVPTASLFSTPEWVLSWCEAFGRGRELFVVALHDEAGGEMVALAPLAFAPRKVWGRLRRVELLGDGSADSDNLEILALPGREREAVAAVLDALEAERAAWDVGSFNTMPGDSPTGRALLVEMDKRGWTTYAARWPTCAIPLPATWEEYLRRQSSSERKKMRRFPARLAERFRVRFVRCSDSTDIAQRLEQLFALHAKRWQTKGETGTFASPDRRTFYRLLSLALISRDWLEFWVLEADDIPVAAQFVFRYRETAYALQEGFDPVYEIESVGYVLRTHTLHALIDSGIRKYDFLGGVNAGKLRWGAVVGEYVFLTFARPFTLGAAYTRMAAAAGRTRAFVRDHSPRPVIDLIRRGTFRLRQFGIG